VEEVIDGEETSLMCPESTYLRIANRTRHCKNSHLLSERVSSSAEPTSAALPSAPAMALTSTCSACPRLDLLASRPLTSKKS